MKTKNDPVGNKGRRYAEQVLDESFFKLQVPWTAIAEFYELSLHTGEPQADDGGLQFEISYPKYERPRLPRDMLTWARDGNVVRNRIDARFALYQDGPVLAVSHWALTPIGESGPAYVGKFEKVMALEPGMRPVVDAGLIEVMEL
jgi:hypothetical protein